MGTINIFDLLIMFSGIYLIYAAIVMKKDGRIISGIMTNKDTDVNRMKDKEGFIHYMFGKVLLLGIVTAAVGITGIVNTKLGGPIYISLIEIVLFLIVLVVFVVASGKARKKYIEGKE